MLESGLIMSVSDAYKLREGASGYRKLVNDLFTIVRGFGGQVPEGGWPAPKTQPAGSATAYYWPIPQMGQEPSVQPNIALSKSLLTITLSPQHAARLHDSKSFSGDVAKLSGGNGPTDIAWVDFAGIIKLVRPWVNTMGVPALMAEAKADAPEGLRPADIPAQVATVFDVLSCLKTFAAATYAEGGATVTHHKTVIQDIK